MNSQSLSDITSYLFFLAIGIIVLAALLLFLSIVILILRLIARRNAARNDIDQIGREALVIKTIRPNKHGQIRYQTSEGIRQADAESEQMIRNGHLVIIQGVVKDRFKVRQITEREQQEKEKDQQGKGDQDRELTS